MDQQARLIEQVQRGILQVAEMEERKLDAQLRSLEELGEDEFEALRQKRKIHLQKQMRQEQDWKQLGHGSYTEVNDTKDFFNVAKKSSKVIAHFYRGVTPRCQIVDSHLERLAPKHVEARFIKVDVEKSPYLVEKLGIIIMPTIILIKDGKTDHSIRGFDEMGGIDNFETSDMAYVLASHGMINYDGPDKSDEINNRSQKAGFNSMKLNSIKRSDYDGISDEEDDL